ncbi:MAG TPA: adenylate/guanylate cyclase domain-containing protein [Thermoflexia bacterium]|nr:adenylate/guanylate cyclase domain-containing protein [Thermoflexia bacterium]
MDTAIAQLISQIHQTTYLLANQELQVVRMEGPLLADIFTGQRAMKAAGSLPDLVPELLGNEDLLKDILAGREASFHLEHINRVSPDGKSTYYLNITLLPYASKESEKYLLVLINDTTTEGMQAQQLTQQRNELRLLRRQLIAANQQLDHLFRHYVPHDVIEASLEQRLLPQLGGELREVSVLFADLRSYTHISEQILPSRMVELLNEYLALACEAINEFGGIIAQFMGDAVFGIFNAPNTQPDHAQRAVRAGLAIQNKTAAYNAPQMAAKKPVLHFGVGINSGPALVGNTGSQWRYVYSAIGDTTNVASRICNATKPQEVWLGPVTQRLLRGAITTVPLTPLLFKGKSQPLLIYQAVAKKS